MCAQLNIRVQALHDGNGKNPLVTQQRHKPCHALKHMLAFMIHAWLLSLLSFPSCFGGTVILVNTYAVMQQLPCIPRLLDVPVPNSNRNRGLFDCRIHRLRSRQRRRLLVQQQQPLHTSESGRDLSCILENSAN